MTERKPPKVSWESFVEHQIREAQDAGEFDSLPGMGKPIPDIDEPYDEWWWLKKKARQENISILPPALEILLDVEKTLERVWLLAAEEDVREAIKALNQRIRHTHYTTVWGPPPSTMPLEIEQVVAEWKKRKTGNH